MSSENNYTPEADSLSAQFALGAFGQNELITLWVGNFRRVESELRKEIERLEKNLGAQPEEWETLAYRHLRDTANKEEIEYILLGGVVPDEIDRRMKSALKDIYPDPGYANPA